MNSNQPAHQVNTGHARLRFVFTGSALRLAGFMLILCLSIFGMMDEALATNIPSTTSLAGSPNPSVQGQIVAFVATITTAQAITPIGGTVTFSDNGNAISGAIAVSQKSNTSAQASFQTSALTVGSHTITAAYSGAAIGPILASSGTTTQVVNAAVNAPTGATDSQKLRSLQIFASQTAASASGQAISGAIESGIADAFSSGTGPIIGGPNGLFFSSAFAPETPDNRINGAFSALAYATKAPPGAATAAREWNLWADIRGTGWDISNNGGTLRGDQLNVTVGLGRKLTPDFLVGIVGGYENFHYDSALLNGTVNGNGGSIGAYAAWRLASLRFDAALTWSDIDYNAVSGAAAGSFTGHRWLTSGGVTDTRALGNRFVIEPSVQVFALWENQNAFTDSAGTVQASHDFSVGRVSSGGKLIYNGVTAGSNFKLTPYAGVYADYRFSTGIGSTQPIGVPILSVVDGWSARFTSGVTLTRSDGAKLNIGGEFGGVGSGSYNVWSGQIRGSLPF